MTPPTLLTPGRIDGFETRNRLFMAPMTRSRALAGGVPSELAIDYYAQRASAGLILTEGVAPSAIGLGYARTPAIESAEQIAAWKKITAAVKAKGGRMFMQFMHVGRIGHAVNGYTSEPLIAPSVVRANGQIWTDAQGLQDFDTPRAIETNETHSVRRDDVLFARPEGLHGFSAGGRAERVSGIRWAEDACTPYILAAWRPTESPRKSPRRSRERTVPAQARTP